MKFWSAFVFRKHQSVHETREEAETNVLASIGLRQEDPSIGAQPNTQRGDEPG